MDSNVTHETREEFWSRLQREQAIWVAHNFGNRPAYQPLLGIVEELGELAEAKTADDKADAVADVMIFMSDYCNALGIGDVNMAALVAAADREASMSSTVVIVGRLAHAALKREQGIRGDRSEHERAIARELAHIIANMQMRAGSLGTSLEKLVAGVWARVRERNWKCRAPGCGQMLEDNTRSHCDAHTRGAA
ncbi:MAG TPA: hypothetical protein VE261_00380 [Gaiellaceae bacterium]|nr:hypothetical protein [Gaiellaceae bacterium]